MRFNEPRDPEQSHKINRYIRNAIANTPKGESMKLVTWNFSNQLFVNDIIAAHKRGVSVRLIMANGLAESQSRTNGYFWQVQRALEKGNKKRPGYLKSWARTCKNSCRGKEGIQHGKWFMFSRTGGRNIVVMSTSANLTDAAAYNQWNDLLTVQGRQVTYDDYVDRLQADVRATARSSPRSRPSTTGTTTAGSSRRWASCATTTSSACSTR